jgi:formylglycine-generating enzyme required for sulfatase activity
MDWVTVGDAGNAADRRIMNDQTTGYGGVDYTYLMGKYEVTNAQYCAFLNAVARSDLNGRIHSVNCILFPGLPA